MLAKDQPAAPESSASKGSQRCPLPITDPKTGARVAFERDAEDGVTGATC